MSTNANRFLVQLGPRIAAVLGAIFIAAAVPKIIDPPQFAQMIYNYKLTPAVFINVVAIYLPWFELVLGLALITGVAWRGAATVVGALLVFFIVLLSINLLRGHAIDCGCFSVTPVEKTEAEMFAEMRWTILRDVGMLAMVGYAFWTEKWKAAKAVG